MDTQSTLCEADDVVQPRRDAARARRVRAQRKIHLAGGDDVGGAGTRAAGNEGRVERIGHRAIGRARAVQAAGELVQVGLAEQLRTAREQPLHHRGMPLRLVREGRAAGGGGQVFDVDVVLDREAQAGERTLGRQRDGAFRPRQPGRRRRGVIGGVDGGPQVHHG
jgi:hypothetical protein